MMETKFKILLILKKSTFLNSHELYLINYSLRVMKSMKEMEMTVLEWFDSA